jgi:hypothetical protein
MWGVFAARSMNNSARDLESRSTGGTGKAVVCPSDAGGSWIAKGLTQKQPGSPPRKSAHKLYYVKYKTEWLLIVMQPSVGFGKKSKTPSVINSAIQELYGRIYLR